MCQSYLMKKSPTSILGLLYSNFIVSTNFGYIIPDDSSKASASKDSEWQRLDDIVRTWIYGSISPSLLQSIVRHIDCGLDAWTRIENNFQNNKISRILHLESQFNEISLSNFPNVKSYCNELETIATSLDNLGTSISDNCLSLQVLQGLNSDYKTFRSLVHHMNHIPSFDIYSSFYVGIRRALKP